MPYRSWSIDLQGVDRPISLMLKCPGMHIGVHHLSIRSRSLQASLQDLACHNRARMLPSKRCPAGGAGTADSHLLLWSQLLRSRHPAGFRPCIFVRKEVLGTETVQTSTAIPWCRQILACRFVEPTIGRLCACPQDAAPAHLRQNTMRAVFQPRRTGDWMWCGSWSWTGR